MRGRIKILMKFYYRFTRDERALVDDLLAVILSVFIVLVLYIALGPIYNQLYPRAVEVAPAGSLDLVNTFWGKFAVAVVLWAVIFLFISALRRTGYTYR